ncbi:hypothetical protein HMPREF9381_0390 [Streptococcus sanguinis SK72]|uniref:Uncharacterized protein n=1 Tax=Streptococcus sanguinis SK72 TaxID=888809 RepID=F0HZQ0_STRSA|nr:hypothetical protein HMPREF9381_0390 [Streptococcus sanguinis SK72]
MMENKKQIEDEQPCEKFIICYLSLRLLFLKGKACQVYFL